MSIPDSPLSALSPDQMPAVAEATLAAAALAAALALLQEERRDARSIRAPQLPWVRAGRQMPDAPWPTGRYRWHEAERPW